jgi:hypothetical protein
MWVAQVAAGSCWQLAHVQLLSHLAQLHQQEQARMCCQALRLWDFGLKFQCQCDALQLGVQLPEGAWLDGLAPAKVRSCRTDGASSS